MSSALAVLLALLAGTQVMAYPPESTAEVETIITNEVIVDDVEALGECRSSLGLCTASLGECASMIGEFNGTLQNCMVKLMFSTHLMHLMASTPMHRLRRSPEVEADDTNKDDEAINKLTKALDEFKTGLNSFVNNVTSSPLYADVTQQLQQLGDNIQDAGKRLKTSLQAGYNNLTATSEQ